MVGDGVHVQVVPGVADGPDLDVPSRQGPVQEGPQPGALGGAGRYEVEELLVAVAVQDALPALGEVLLERSRRGVVGDEQGHGR